MNYTINMHQERVITLVLLLPQDITITPFSIELSETSWFKVEIPLEQVEGEKEIKPTLLCILMHMKIYSFNNIFTLIQHKKTPSSSFFILLFLMKRGESIYGGKFEDEITRNLKHTGAGIVSMANAGKNTNGSQFFITLKPTPFLDGKHTVLGRICTGMGIVQRMGMVATDTEDRPKVPIIVHSATAFRGLPEVDNNLANQ